MFKKSPPLQTIFDKKLETLWNILARFSSPSLFQCCCSQSNSKMSSQHCPGKNMNLNPRKCKTMTFGFLQYNSCVPQSIVVGGFQTEQASSFKLLSVFVSEDLTWVANCDYVVKKANRRLYALGQLKKMWCLAFWYNHHLL